jgi:hypothetical protein
MIQYFSFKNQLRNSSFSKRSTLIDLELVG